MPTFFFSYRGGEITAAVNADTHKQALHKLESGVDTLFVVNASNLHASMWESTDADGAPIDPDAPDLSEDEDEE